MSRFPDGEGDEWFPNQSELYRRSIRNALGGRRAKALLDEFVQALEAMPEHRLISGAIAKEGDVCSVAAHVAYRKAKADGLAWRDAAAAVERSLYDGLTWSEYAAVHPDAPAPDEEDNLEDGDYTMDLAESLGWPRCLGWLLGDQNDNTTEGFTPEERWEYVHLWALLKLGLAEKGELTAYVQPIRARLQAERDRTSRYWQECHDRKLRRWKVQADYTYQVRTLALMPGIA